MFLYVYGFAVYYKTCHELLLCLTIWQHPYFDADGMTMKGIHCMIQLLIM